MGMKGWFARVCPARDSLGDLRALQNRRHFGSTMLGDKMHKTPFFRNLIIIVYFNNVSIIYNVS
jgi:hypothetical protein